MDLAQSHIEKDIGLHFRDSMCRTPPSLDRPCEGLEHVNDTACFAVPG